MPTTDTRILNIDQATKIATVLSWAQRNARLNWLPVDNQDGRVIEGVARSVGHENGDFAGPDDDVRDLYLRISGTFEWFIPMIDVLAMLRRGLIAEAL